MIQLLHSLQQYKFLLSDVLPHLSNLSRVFQRDTVDLTTIRPRVTTVLALIDQMKENPGPNLGKFISELDGTPTKFNGHEIVTSHQQETDFLRMKNTFVSNLERNLLDRFPQVDLLQAFSILDPNNLREYAGVWSVW